MSAFRVEGLGCNPTMPTLWELTNVSLSSKTYRHHQKIMCTGSLPSLPSCIMCLNLSRPRGGRLMPLMLELSITCHPLNCHRLLSSGYARFLLEIHGTWYLLIPGSITLLMIVVAYICPVTGLKEGYKASGNTPSCLHYIPYN